MAVIELRNVTKRYAGITAVEGASLTVGDGEFFILVGPSGCGKSTLLNMIVGLEDVTSGEIRVDGELVNDLDPRQRNMAMVFQSYAIYPHMTVRENMAFPLRLAKLPREEIDRRVEAAAGILELTPLLGRKPRTLSGGQRQRVAMGRAIVRQPRVFLLDEPLSNLDAKLRSQMRTEIGRLQRQLGTTTLYVTHDQTEALTLGDRIAVLRHGDIQQIGTPRELYDRPANAFVAGFIGSPAMNFLPARADGRRILLPVGCMDVPRDTPIGREDGKALLAGFRPEHLQVVAQGVDTSGRCCFTSKVAVKEWLGAELFVHFDIALRDFAPLAQPKELGIDAGDGAAAKLVARIDPEFDVKEGQELTMSIAPDKVLLFDAASGELCG
jgi:multiple sugar transport system ATP-binding protein